MKKTKNIWNILNQLKYIRWVDNEHISITNASFKSGSIDYR